MRSTRRTSASLRVRLFRRVAACYTSQPEARLIIITHLLEDRPELLDVMNDLVPIATVIGKPYSVVDPVRSALEQRFQVEVPRLTDLENPTFVCDLVCRDTENHPIVIMEIGGYCATRCHVSQIV